MPLTNNEIKKIVSFLKKPYVSAIFLIGSYAKGTETENSDVDILVIIDIEDKNLIAEYALMNRSFINSTIDISKKIGLVIIGEKDAIELHNIPISQRINGHPIVSSDPNPIPLYVKESKRIFYLS